MINKIKLFAISIVGSTIVFFLIYESISYMKYQEHFNISYPVTEPSSKVKSIKSEKRIKLSTLNIDSHRHYIKCKKLAFLEHDLFRNCSEKLKIKEIDLNIEKIKIKHYRFLHDFKKSNPIIFIIYIFLILTLALQFYLFLLQYTNNILKEKDFHISEWSINTAPMFGLLGTFFSIAILLNSGTSNISIVLIKNFFDAVMTTIIGIIFYIINFYLKIYIYPSIRFDNQDG